MNSVIFGRAAIVAALLLGGGVLLAAPTAAPSRFAESAEKAAEMPTSALMQTALAAFRRGDHAEARRSFRLLAQRDIAAAETLLGTMAANGQGGPKDDAIAAAWFLRAASRGYAPAPRLTVPAGVAARPRARRPTAPGAPLAEGAGCLTATPLPRAA